MHLRHVFGVVLIPALSVVAVHAAGQLSTPAETQTFLTALDGCSTGKASTPHPLIPSFVVEHTVLGEKNGACDYRQTMPGKMTMVCALTPAGRRTLSADLKTMVSGGPMRGGTNAAQPEWTKECQVELPNGTRIPAAQPARSK